MHDAEGPQSDAEGTFFGRRRKDRVAPIADNLLKRGDQPTF